jgi:hypothetical protein
MARVTPAEYAEKWNRRLSQSTEDIRRGIARVSEAPGIRAAANKEAMLANLTKAVNDGTWENQVRSVTLEDWKKAATEKGVSRIPQGVASASASQVTMAERLLPAVDASVAEVNKTKRGDLEANITRMTTFARSMAARKLRRGAR